MKIEKLKQNKKIAVIIIGSITLFSVGVLSLSLAKYRSTNSINIAKGTIKYNRPDLHLAEVYVESDSGEYELASEVPESGIRMEVLLILQLLMKMEV